jgi:hypothetical protein
MTVYVHRTTEGPNAVHVNVWYTPDGCERTQIERWNTPNAEVHPFIDRTLANIRATFGAVQVVSY